MTSVEKSEKGSDKNLAADKNQKPLFQDGNIEIKILLVETF